ncbi:hypothetical protein R0131_03205 [Clostridium sp. AL.422]|uniref:hypothetical protein n=1 Tax=Clostridium TaxID=1485 RepID=UPI00293DD63B|nr:MULTISPECIES: hypothetical protein [unclassified Clostridium]MDV4149836.1 hypothetical protein [Clostridium sp. AL.422]
MNTRCGMKRKKNTTRWLAGLLIVALTISSILLPGSGVSAKAENLDIQTTSVENLTSDTDDKEDLNGNTADNANLDSKITDDENINSKTLNNEKQKTRTVDNKNINSNITDNKSLDLNTINNNQNISTITDENLDNKKNNYSSNYNEESTVNSPISTLSEDEIEAYANESYTAENFFEASMPSTNGHYEAKGIFVDSNGNATLVLKVQKNSTIKEINYVKINNTKVEVTDEYSPIEIISGESTITINLPSGNKKEVYSKNGFILIDIGSFNGIINENGKFTLTVKTGAGGWDIDGLEVSVNINYKIIKNANVTSAKIGDKITYTVTVLNESDITLYDIKVIDNIPNGIKIESVRIGDSIEAPKIENNILILEEGLSLSKDKSKSYIIVATVEGENIPGTITNKATMTSNSFYPKSDTADVTVTKDVIIKKVVAGNMGDTTKEFNFNAIVKKNNKEYKNVSFKLGHKGIFDELIEIPADAIIILSELDAIKNEGEDDYDYDVTVSINDEEFTMENGVCTIELGEYDTGIVNITVTNTKNVEIDTGVILDSLPYIAILVVVIIGGGIFFINKRKKENDI